MAKTRIELNSSGIQELLKSSEIIQICETQAQRMSRAAGVPYVSDVFVGKVKANVRARIRKGGSE